MRRLVYGFSAFLALGIAQAVQSAQNAEYPYGCYWVTGRLFASNGAPGIRLWPRRTNRLLGIVCKQRGCGNPEELLPPKLLKFGLNFDRSLWGDFRVCPLEKEREGWMRMVRLVDGKNITVVDYR